MMFFNYPISPQILSIRIIRIITDPEVLNKKEEPICSVLNTLKQDIFMRMPKVMDIYSKNPYPSGTLSNFKRCSFDIDGVKCSSIEGVLQSLKVIIPSKKENPQLWKERMDLQRKVCSYANNKAKRTGSFLNFFNPNLELNWRGKKMGRNSKEYKDFLKKVFEARYMSDPEYRQALYDTKDMILTHNIGRKDKRKTILTENEFLSMLSYLKIKFGIK